MHYLNWTYVFSEISCINKLKIIFSIVSILVRIYRATVRIKHEMCNNDRILLLIRLKHHYLNYKNLIITSSIRNTIICYCCYTFDFKLLICGIETHYVLCELITELYGLVASLDP